LAYGLALRAHITMVVVLAHFDLPLVSYSVATLLMVIRTPSCSVIDHTLTFLASLPRHCALLAQYVCRVTGGTLTFLASLPRHFTLLAQHVYRVTGGKLTFSCVTATSLHTAGTTRVQSHRWHVDFFLCHCHVTSHCWHNTFSESQVATGFDEGSCSCSLIALSLPVAVEVLLAVLSSVLLVVQLTVLHTVELTAGVAKYFWSDIRLGLETQHISPLDRYNFGCTQDAC
jgi:hypothetical protein